MKAAQALQLLACARHSIFESTDNRVAYVSNFVAEIVQFLQSPALQAFVMKDRQLYKEFIPILLKIQNTFQVRDMSKAGDALLEGYLSELFNFTVQSYKLPNESIKFHASKLNHLWQRVFFESMALNVSCQGRLETIVIQLITCFLDGNLEQKAGNPLTSDQADEDADDEDENFDMGERTQKQEDLDWFAKLMRQKIQESLDLLL